MLICIHYIYTVYSYRYYYKGSVSLLVFVSLPTPIVSIIINKIIVEYTGVSDDLYN